MSDTRPIRVASWPPWYAPNRYIPCFHAALAAFGIEHVPGLALDADELKRRQVHVLHLHWAEWAWQSQGVSVRRQRAGVDALFRVLDGAERHGLTVVWTVHNLETHEGDPECDALGFGALHLRAALRIFHSAHARAQALRQHGGAGDTIVMPHGNYDDVLPPPRPAGIVRSECNVPPAASLLLCAGNVRRYKGIDAAIDSLDVAGDDDRYLIVAGRCRDEGLARELELRAAADRRVRLDFGPLSDQRLADLLHAADVALLPYREVTGSGALLAALTAGRGVVATDLPYFREVLAPEPSSAVLAASATPEALADAVTACLTDRLPRGAAARRLADRYAWPRVVPPVAAWLAAHVRR